MIRVVQVVFLVFVLFMCSCIEKPCEEVFVINSFEKDEDFDRLHWKCRTLFTLSEKGVTHGRYALELTMAPSPYPGVSFHGIPRNWSCFSCLSFSAYNPSDKTVKLTLRIDDKKESYDYYDRVNKKISINPGANNINIPFEDLVCPNGRMLDKSHVYRLMLFSVHPQKKVVLYIDALQLEAASCDFVSETE